MRCIGLVRLPTSLADVADATALNNELDTSRQCISLVRLSRALSRRMATKSLTDARLETAAAGPKTSSRTDLSDWLQGVVEVLSDEALRAAFLGTGGWRPPDSIRLGETLAGGLREVLFDLKDMPGMEVEVASPDGFANSRWRLGEAGREHAFLGTRQVENSWRAYLVLSEGDPRALFVWTDTVRPQDLRVRLIAGGGTVTA